MEDLQLLSLNNIITLFNVFSCQIAESTFREIVEAVDIIYTYYLRLKKKLKCVRNVKYFLCVYTTFVTIDQIWIYYYKTVPKSGKIEAYHIQKKYMV